MNVYGVVRTHPPVHAGGHQADLEGRAAVRHRHSMPGSMKGGELVLKPRDVTAPHRPPFPRPQNVEKHRLLTIIPVGPGGVRLRTQGAATVHCQNAGFHPPPLYCIHRSLIIRAAGAV